MYSILIVDDEPLTRQYLKINIPLIDHNWKVTAEAMDGQEALEILGKQKIDLIITDIKMPVINGLELCKIISEQFPKQKVVILSGYDEFDFAKQAIHYGVHEYLLKPIVREELKSILHKIAKEITQEKNRATAFKAMIKLSEDSKKQVIKNFLKAVISDAAVEIRALYPLVFRMKVNFIESEGIIMIINLDEDVILQSSVPVNDIPVFKLLLNQITTQIVEKSVIGHVFFDHEENTIVLLTGETINDIMRSCKKVYQEVAATILTETGITVTAAVGVPVNDVLQLNISYVKAREVLLSRLSSGNNRLYTYEECPIDSNYFADLNQSVAAIKSGILTHNEMEYSLSIIKYVELMNTFTLSEVLRYGIHMIKSIAHLNQNTNVEIVNSALKKLESIKCCLCSSQDSLNKEQVVTILKDIIKTLTCSPLEKENHVDDNHIVHQAKDYIYTHYFEPISLGQIAEKVGVSSSYLSNLFHKSVGESYIKFLTKVRMEQAARLLKTDSSKKVYDIAEKVGYVSAKHFSYVFKQHFKMTPGEYQSKYSDTGNS